MINLIFRYVSVWALTFVAFWSEETSSVNVVRRSAIFVPDLNLTQAANWLCRNTFQDDIRGLNVYWSVLVKRYLLHLQGGIERRWKGHTVWLLPRDPDDTVGHHIVLHTKETHLDPRQLPSFPGGPFFFPGFLNLIQWESDRSCFTGGWDREEARKSEGVRLIDLIIYGIAKPPSVHSD